VRSYTVKLITERLCEIVQ